jgi:hypothetical protein
MRYFFLLVTLAGLILNGSLLKAQQPDTGHSAGCKVCVSEPKQNTRKVYACKNEEYCLPRCSLIPFLQSCNDVRCGDLRVRHRLVVKIVPDQETTRCVPRAIQPTPSASEGATERAR